MKKDLSRTIEQPVMMESADIRHGADTGRSHNTIVSDTAKYASNRQKLYKQVRESSKELKRRLNESPNQEELL